MNPMTSAVDLSAAIHARQISCVEVMQATLDRIRKLNGHVNAIISQRNPDDLIAEAGRCDMELAQGKSRGRLHGFPHAVKDLANTKGLLTTMGSPIFADNVPDFDDIMVERLRRCGVIVIGKTNVPEFGKGSHTYNPVFGTTLNAYDQSRSAGGSSGGAAVALALGLVPLADGGDMMGSLRNPAGWNNICSLRPSYGRVPNGPLGEVFFAQLSTLGPMARSVGDTAFLLASMAGFDDRAPQSLSDDPAGFLQSLDGDISGKRIGYPGDLSGALIYEPGVDDLCRRALTRFETLGCHVEDVAIGFDPDRIWRSWNVLRHYLEAAKNKPLYNDPAKRALMKPEVIWEIEGGFALTMDQLAGAMADRSAWYMHLRGLFQTYDALILPSAQMFPFPADQRWPKEINGHAMDTYHRWMQVVTPASLAGVPVATVPAGFSADGLPMGLQIIGPAQADLAVLKLARAYETTLDPWVAPALALR